MELTPSFPTKDTLLCRLAASCPGGRIFESGKIGARVLLAINPGRHYEIHDGESSGSHFMDVYREAKRAGLLCCPMSNLVDWTQYGGIVDWNIISDFARLKPFGDYPPEKSAFLVANTANESIMKIAAVHNPDIQHRLFTDYTEALTWLGWI
jgi:hypothetical protein